MSRVEPLGTSSPVDAPVQILEYTVVVIRDSVTMGISKNIGGRFNNKSSDLMMRLQAGDRIIIYGITARPPNNNVYTLDPLEFTIEE